MTENDEKWKNECGKERKKFYLITFSALHAAALHTSRPCTRVLIIAK